MDKKGWITTMRKTSIMLAGILLVIALLLFIYLESQTDITPGWSNPVKIQNGGFKPLLTYYNGGLWLAFYESEKGGWVIKTIHSHNGQEWSSPSVLVKETPQDCSYPYSVTWLERPDGTLWFLWTRGTKEEGCPEVLYYTALTGDRTWTTPHKIHRLDKGHYIRAATNAPGGGLALLGEREKRSYVLVKGERIPASVGFEPFVQSSDEYFMWNPLFILSEAIVSECIDIFLDIDEMLWSVYTERGNADVVFVQRSEDGIVWEGPNDILGEPVSDGRIINQGSTFVFFFYGKSRSLVMMLSSNGLEWSQRSLVVNPDVYRAYDAAGSGDSTLWVVFEGEDGLYMKQYSAEKYEEDVHRIKNSTFQNGVISIGIALLISGSGLVIWRVVNGSWLLSDLHQEGTRSKGKRKGDKEPKEDFPLEMGHYRKI
jgi:hypothetical protein